MFAMQVFQKRLIALAIVLVAAVPCLAVKPTLYPMGVLSTEAGPFKVAVQPEFTLRDPRRKKDLLVLVMYPHGDGPFPIIIFSHGAGGTAASMSALLSYWASHGYICIAPNHADSVMIRQREGKGTGKLDEDYAAAVHDALNDPEALANRVWDIRFLIDALGEIGTRFPAIKDTMDIRRIGVAGHSLGSYTAMLTLGTGIDLKGTMTEYTDQRVSCALMLSAQGPGTLGLTEQSWKYVRRPFMVITGSDDRGLDGADPQTRTQPYLLSPPGDKFLIFIQGANHYSFPGFTVTQRQNPRAKPEPIRRGSSAPPAPPAHSIDTLASTEPRTAPNGPEDEQRAIYAYVRLSSLAFWNTYLKHDRPSRDFLLSNDLKDFSHGKAAIQSR
jgi:predicted dienelactone hydrolase